jgi:hypothetical protein
VNLIVANEITPHLTAEEYLDKGEYENELKQVCGGWRPRAQCSRPCSPIFHVNVDVDVDALVVSCLSVQVVGDTQAAFDITQYDTLIFGANGLLLAGPNSRTYEPLLCAYLQFISMDLFVRNLFNRIMGVLDDFKEVCVSVCLCVCVSVCLCVCVCLVYRVALTCLRVVCESSSIRPRTSPALAPSMNAALSVRRCGVWWRGVFRRETCWCKAARTR